MANPTTNYGFVLPTATDLVTDLPADFDVALQGVDTRLKALQPGTTLGDLAYSSATANTNTRLPIGTNGQVLAVVGGVPAWTTGVAGDIEGVTAGVGISGGGTSGTVTVTNSMATAIDAKGDLIAGTAADTFSRLAIGTNNQVLTADSTEATGMKWATPAAGGMTSIASGTLSGASLDLTSISSSYNNLQLVLRGFYFNNAANCRITINNTNGIYTLSDLGSASNSAMNTSDIQITSGAVWEDATNKNAAVLDFFDYKSTTSYKVITSKVISQNNASSGANNNLYNVNIWAKDANAISRITLYPSFGNFSGGTYILYGVK